MSEELQQMVDLACDLARAAGRLAMKDLPLGRWRGDGIEHKGGRELVSRVDRDTESFLVRGIRDAYPDHGIYGEEGGEREATPEAAFRWIIDPIDGTTNFLHGHPMFAISIAVERTARQEGNRAELVVAVVHAPYFGETYFAERGVGSFMNSRTIRLEVSATERLDDALVATGFAYDRKRYPNYERFLRMARASRGIRRCGAASLDLAFVAAGRYDAFWELGLRSHDVAAGALLVREAAGTVVDFAGGDDWLDGGNIIACNGRLVDEVRSLVCYDEPE